MEKYGLKHIRKLSPIMEIGVGSAFYVLRAIDPEHGIDGVYLTQSELNEIVEFAKENTIHNYHR